MVVPRPRRGKLTLVLVACLVVSVVVLTGKWIPTREGAVLVPVRSAQADTDDPAMVLSLFPSEPIVTEGESFQVTCLASGADHVFFELPKLSRDLLSSIRAGAQVGGAVLSFVRVQRGHKAKYICHAVNKAGFEKIGIVDVDVTERGQLYRTDGQGGVEGVEERDGVREEVKWESDEEGGEGEEGEGGGRREGGNGGKTEGGEGQQGGEGEGRGREEGDEWEVEKRKEVEEGKGREEKRVVDLGGAHPDSAVSTVPTFKTMEDRAKYQREQVDAFCKRHDLDYLKYQLPIPIPDRWNRHNNVYTYNRHLLLDDRHGIIFCFVPKIGCTNLKLIVFASQGLIPRSELSQPRDAINQKLLETVMSENSFHSVRDDYTKLMALQTYYKFTMFRNPLERLASSYRSKVERFPLLSLSNGAPPFNWLRKDIYMTIRHREYMSWRRNFGRTPVNISFADFVQYWTHFQVLNKLDGYLDEHFMMISDMCQPCRTRFDFYGNFHHFERDAEVLIHRIGANSSDLRQGYYSEGDSTEKQMKVYYSTLTREQKRALLSKMALELDFHYSIFPEERDSHKQILDIEEDIPMS